MLNETFSVIFKHRVNVPILPFPGTFISNYHLEFGRYQFGPGWATKSFPIFNWPCKGLSKFTNFSWSFDTRTALSHLWFTILNWSQDFGTRRVESESLLLIYHNRFYRQFSSLKYDESTKDIRTKQKTISGNKADKIQNWRCLLGCMQNDNLYNNPEITLSFL